MCFGNSNVQAMLRNLSKRNFLKNGSNNYNPIRLIIICLNSCYQKKIMNAIYEKRYWNMLKHFLLRKTFNNFAAIFHVIACSCQQQASIHIQANNVRQNCGIMLFLSGFQVLRVNRCDEELRSITELSNSISQKIVIKRVRTYEGITFG